MPIKINGTNTAANPSITGDDTDTGIVYGSDQIDFSIGGTSKLTLDSSGRLLVGTTTEGAAGADEFTINTPSGHGGMTIRNDTSSNANIWFSDGTSGAAEYAGYLQYAHASDALVFGVNGSERLRIDSSGDVFIANTSFSSGSKVKQFEINSNAISTKSSASATGLQYHNEFHNSNGMVGSISTNGSGTSFNESSDYRLKENVTAISDGITRLKTLKPSRFNFKVDKDKTVDGFLAHEVTLAVPEAITGTKDETQDILYTEDDTIPSGKKIGDVKEVKPIYQGIDKSKLVPLLTAALQEAVTKIETLETKVAALEAK